MRDRAEESARNPGEALLQGGPTPAVPDAVRTEEQKNGRDRGQEKGKENGRGR